MGEKNNMKIQEILKELNILETSLGGDDLVLAKVSRNDLAVVATRSISFHYLFFLELTIEKTSQSPKRTTGQEKIALAYMLFSV